MPLEQIVTFSPAYNHGKEGGIGAMLIRFVLRGDRGATQFLIGTDWYLPEDQKNPIRYGISRIQPQGWDVGYHSPHPQFEGHQAMECELMPLGQCFYDGSSLQAMDMIPSFLAGGSDWLWKELEKNYYEIFGKEEQNAL